MLEFSVVTVVRNNLTGLEKTHASLSVQTHSSYEWVVIDGASRDGSVEFLEHEAGGFCRWMSELDGGIYEAMNKGVTMARGNYVVFMNGGDVFAEDTVLESVAKCAKDQESPDVIYGGARLMLRGKTWLFRGPKVAERYIQHGIPANHQATYYRREVLVRQPYDLTYKIAADYDLAARLFQSGARAAYLPKALVEFEGAGLSYKNPGLLIRECYRIQDTVLGIPRFQRVLSAMRRGFNVGCTLLLSRS